MATTVWAVIGVLIVVAFLFLVYAVKTAADVETGANIAETEIVDTYGVNVRCSDCGRTIQIGYNQLTYDGRQAIKLRSIVEEIAEHRVTDCSMADV